MMNYIKNINPIIFLFIIFLTGNIYTGLPYEYGIIPIFFALIFFLNSFSIKASYSLLYQTFTCLFFLSICSVLIYSNLNNFKEAIFFMFAGCGVVIAETIHSKIVKKATYIILIIYLIFALFDAFLPGFSQVKSLCLIKSFYPEDNLSGFARGVSSLSTEPSYFALIVFSCWIIIYSNSNFKGIDFKFFLVSLLCLIMSKSAMSLLVAPVIFFSSNFNYKYRIFIGLTIFLAIILLFFPHVILSRATILFNMLLSENSLDLISQDESAGSRLFYVMKDFKFALNIYLLPIGPGSYDFISNLMLNKLTISPHNSNYSLSMSGSLLGRFLVEYGILIIGVIILLWSKLLDKSGLIKSCLISFFIVSLLFQMISLVFAPISFSIGFFLTKLLNKAKG